MWLCFNKMGLVQEQQFANSYATQSELTLGRAVSKPRLMWLLLGQRDGRRNKKKFKERFTSLYFFLLSLNVSNLASPKLLITVLCQQYKAQMRSSTRIFLKFRKPTAAQRKKKKKSGQLAMMTKHSTARKQNTKELLELQWLFSSYCITCKSYACS